MGEQSNLTVEWLRKVNGRFGSQYNFNGNQEQSLSGKIVQTIDEWPSLVSKGQLVQGQMVHGRIRYDCKLQHVKVNGRV